MGPERGELVSILNWPVYTWPLFGLAGILLGQVIWRHYAHRGHRLVVLRCLQAALVGGVLMGIARLLILWVER